MTEPGGGSTQGKVKRGQRCYLAPIQLTGYTLVLHTVADRAAVRTRSRVAAAQPLLYQRLHLFVRELVAQLYRRVARCGGKILSSLLILSAVPLMAETASL